MLSSTIRGAPLQPGDDIYSLGVLLCRLTTLAFPVTARSPGELIAKHRRAEKVPPGDRSPDL